MKLDPSTIIEMVKRKSVSWFGAAVVGAWSVIAYPEFRAWLERGMEIVGPVGIGFLVASIVMSTKNEIQGVKDVDVALHMAPPGATIIEACKGEVVPK